MEKLADKNILIVGATGGIGRNLVKQLVQSGARVYMAARNRPALTSIGADLDLPSERLFRNMNMIVWEKNLKTMNTNFLEKMALKRW